MFPTPPSSGLSLYSILCYYWLYSAQRSSSVEAGRVTSFLLPYLVECQNTKSSGNGSSLNPRIDEYLIRSTVWSFVDFFDWHDQSVMFNSLCFWFLNFLAENLASHSSGAGSNGDEGAYRDSVEFHTSDEHTDPSLPQEPTFQQPEGLVSAQEYRPLLQESVGISTIPLSQGSPGMLRHSCTIFFKHWLLATTDLFLGASDGANYTLSDLTPQSYMYSEEQTFYQQLRPEPGFVQVGQKKVQCTLCSKVVRRDGYTRHVNETHLRAVKGVCTRCRKTFQRKYLKTKHEITCRGYWFRSLHVAPIYHIQPSISTMHTCPFLPFHVNIQPL
jgi:hypothetical protein